MKYIPLTQGKFAIVDDADFEWLNQFKWHVATPGRCFYAVRTTKIDGVCKLILMHREILGLLSGDGLGTDHINHNGLDNRRCNLRICTSQQNQRNRRIDAAKKTSRYKGVGWNKQLKQWRSRIYCNYKEIYLGCFRDEAEAARVYDTKAKELYGEFACLNFPPKQETKAIA